MSKIGWEIWVCGQPFITAFCDSIDRSKLIPFSSWGLVACRAFFLNVCLKVRKNAFQHFYLWTTDSLHTVRRDLVLCHVFVRIGWFVYIIHAATRFTVSPVHANGEMLAYMQCESLQRDTWHTARWCETLTAWRNFISRTKLSHPRTRVWQNVQATVQDVDQPLQTIYGPETNGQCMQIKSAVNWLWWQLTRPPTATQMRCSFLRVNSRRLSMSCDCRKFSPTPTRKITTFGGKLATPHVIK
jgi:hypothetical protein